MGRHLALVVFGGFLAGCSAAGSSGGGGGGSGGGGPPPGSLAGGLHITEVSVNQAVKIPIMQNGGAVSNRNAPVVQGRPAVLRVFVTPDPGYQPRDILGRLAIAGQPDQTITKTVSGPSVDGDTTNSFDFDVPFDQITAGTQLFVDLEEVGGAASVGATDGARWPVSGTADLGAESANGPFKVVAVPVVMNGITPDTSPAHVQALHDALVALYPATDVQLNVVNPINYPSGAVSATGNGWAQALQWVAGLRNQLGVDSQTFIYGMLAPANSLQQYCGGGCVAGLGTVPKANDPYGRASIGIGYFPDGSGGPSAYSGGATMTMAHELGHALGRNHSPCAPPGAQLTGIDSAYPYQGASIGVWGWDLVAKQSKNPASAKDVMGYCTPEWISDYTYSNIFAREAYVNSHAFIIPSPDPARAPGTFRVAIIEPDGTMHWSGTQDFAAPQYGEKRDVDVLDANGNTTGHVVGFYTPVADLPGGMLFVRQSALPSATGAIRAASLSRTVLRLR